ncbi:hypothetical protein TrRE_jg2243 [Triparma retinervis]|uniref:PCI domain-containing protein n=1 Tax=Triparma retinervis TaxID=2557542 RepID=A0A9W7G0F3_9STRA|nr:hypothetical protein TrRE_jg2243 [Triparma retinervis]
MPDSMEVDPNPTPPPPPVPAVVEEEDDSVDLADALASAEDKSTSIQNRRKSLTEIVTEPERFSLFCVRVKESAVYALARNFCEGSDYTEILSFVTTTCGTFFDNINKAKVAKIVRQVLDIVSLEAPNEHEMLADVCKAVVKWCKECNRTFLRQRVESKLASVWFLQGKFSDALELISALLTELKKLDDKQLLVETHLTEAKIHHGLTNIPKAKAALTASRTCANAIYGDYNTAHSYFLEAFEQLDQLNDTEKAIPCLKYMMLCKILDSLGKTLKLSARGIPGMKTSKADAELSGLVTGKQGVKYAGIDIEAMTAIANAASKRDLSLFEATTAKYSEQLQTDILIKHHLHILLEQLLESNLLRLIEPFSCVEIAHIASLIDMEPKAVEKKISQMILDDKLNGILNQGEGQLILHEEERGDKTSETGKELIKNMGKVVDNLFKRSQTELVMR